jgi:hypothetical protein
LKLTFLPLWLLTLNRKNLNFMSEPKSIKEANDRLAALGEKRRVFRTLESAKLAVSQAEGKKPKFPHQAPPAGPKPFKPFAESVEDMKAAAKAERDPSKKVDAFEKLAARLESDLKGSQIW